MLNSQNQPDFTGFLFRALVLIASVGRAPVRTCLSCFVLIGRKPLPGTLALGEPYYLYFPPLKTQLVSMFSCRLSSTISGWGFSSLLSQFLNGLFHTRLPDFPRSFLSCDPPISFRIRPRSTAFVGRPSFLPLARAFRIPAVTRSRIKSRSSWATAGHDCKECLPQQATEVIHIFLVADELNAERAKLFQRRK